MGLKSRAAPVYIRWKKGLSSTIAVETKISINRAIRELSEFVIKEYKPKLKPSIYIYPFYNLPGISGALDALVGLTLTDEGKVYLNSDLVNAKVSPNTDIDPVFLEIVLIHELTHLVVRDRIHHSLLWARTIIDIWKDILNNLPGWQRFRWCEFKELVLLDLKSNLSKTKYMKILDYI